MQHSEQELRKRYSSLGDDDLLELYNGELTDFARVILKEELHKRLSRSPKTGQGV